MHAWAPSPGPIAVALLALEERGAEGSVDFGGRRLVLRRGKVVEVARAPSDPSLLEFLRATGRIDDARAQSLRATLIDPDQIGDALPGVSTESLHDAVRAVWLDRLVRALEESDASGEGVPQLHPTPPLPSSFDASLFGLLLDALERRAASGDAEEIGKRAGSRIEWVAGPIAARARKWADLGPAADLPSVRIGQVLTASPAAPSKIAALVRAGILRVVATRTSIPAPAPRLSMPPPAAAERSSIPPMRAPELRLAPGAARAFDDEIVPPPLPAFPPKGTPMPDPLGLLERRVALLEQRDVEPLERATSWRALGDAMRQKLGAIEEQLRCYREAAALAPTDLDLLFATAELSLATRQPELTLAYGRAAIASQNDTDARHLAMLRYARIARRMGRPSDALAATRAAATLAEGEWAPLVMSGQLEADVGLKREALTDWVDGALAARASDPALSHALLASAYLLDPAAERVADAFAASLAELGYSDASLAVRARAAMATSEPDTRRRALLSTAEKAEMSGHPSLAADLLLAAFDLEPEFDLLYEPLDADLDASSRAVERAVVLEAIARSCGEMDGEEWGLRAARAWLALDSDEARDVGYGILASMAAGGAGRALADLSRLAERGEADAFDALEEAANRAEDAGARTAAIDAIVRRAGTRQPSRLAWAMSERGLTAPDALVEEARADEARLGAVLRELLAARALSASALFDASGLGRRAPGLRSDVLNTLEGIASRDARAALAASRLARIDGDLDRARRILESAAASGEHAGRVARALARLELDPGRATSAWRAALEADPASEEARVRLVAAARATRRPDALEAALVDRLAHVTSAGEEARVAVELAERLHARAPERAAELAERALLADPQEARAALLLLTLVGARTPSAPALAAARSIVGESSEGLAAMARASEDPAEALNATIRWATLSPFAPEPFAAAIEQALARGVDDYVETGVVALLESDRLTPACEPALVRAIEQVATISGVDRACELCVRAAALLGPGGPRLFTLALDLAQRSGNAVLQRDALELGLPPPSASREERAGHLRRIADLHRKNGERPSEARALLRLLAVAPRDPGAVDRLAAIHAENGNVEHLLATLALRTDEAATPVEHAIGMLSLAKAHFEVLGDPVRGEEFLRAAAEPPDATEGEAQRVERLVTVALGLVSLGRASDAVDLLRQHAAADLPGAHRLIERAVEIALRELRDRDRAVALLDEELARRHTLRGRLLLMFEQLALDKRDVVYAERIYGTLVDEAMGESGRRALRYRRARWLERAGASREALAAYVDACSQASSTGAIASALERLSRELGDLDSLGRGLVALAKAAAHPILKERLVQRAARLFFEEMARPERAFDVLLETWKETFSADLEDELARTAAATEEVDPQRGAAAFASIFEVLRARADDAWSGEEKARLLRKAARVHLARGDLAGAEATAREAIAAQRADDPDEMALAGALTELAGWLANAKPAEARALLDEALRLDATNEDAKRLHARLPLIGGSASQRPAAMYESDDVVSSVSLTSIPKPPKLPSVPPQGEAPSVSAKSPSVAPAAKTPSVAPAARTPSAPPVATPPSVAPAARTPSVPPVAKSPSVPPVAKTPSVPPVVKSPSAPPAADSTDREAALPPPAPIAPEAAPVAEAAPAKKPSLLIVPADDDGAHEDDAAPGQRVSLLDLYRSQSSPNVALAHAAPIALPDEDDSNEVDVLLEKAAAASRELESETACALLRAALVADPTRADVAERLAREAEASGSDVERVLALSAIVPPARAVAAWEVSPQAARGTLAAHLVHPAHAPILEVLGRVYESCQPIFRTTLAQLGVLGTDRVGARAATPVARALLATMELFGWEDPQVFLTRRPLASELVRTQPPALLLGLGLPRGEREVRFVVARGLTLARPENVLVASLPEPEGRTLFAAIRAAFGPADGTRVPREAAAMAAELWRLLPPQRQRDVRELLHDRWALLDYDAVRASVLGGAARAGLLVAGDVGAALRALGALETPPVVVAEGRPWIEMARTHGAAADLLRFAFGDALVESARLSR